LLAEKELPNTASAAVESARAQFRALTGHENDSVTGLRPRPEGGWSVLFDVVELERIPASTSVMATFRVDIDATGALCGYERLRRYTRGATDG
jgi:Gas vesicle synthesis protein GvpO